LKENTTINPGITFGRLRVINKKQETISIMNDEILVLKSLDKSMLDVIKKAKGLIIEENPHPEITHILKSFGIPSVVGKTNHLLYSTGDVVSLNATTGEIKRGSMLVS
jgi:phosphohistidine swiveling domain-containing protein